MRVMRETTAWPNATPNHVYVFDDAFERIIGYVPAGTKEVIKLKTPIKIDRRDRTFVPLNDGSLKPDPKSITVKGSTGEIHTLVKADDVWSCSCKGFLFRNTCRHIKEQEEHEQA